MYLQRGQFASLAGLHPAWGANLVNKIATPAAGANFFGVVPGGWYWVPVALRYKLTASAQAGERRAGLQVKDGGGNVLLEILPESVVEPSKAATFSFVREGVGAAGVKNANSSFAMPGVALEPGWEIGDATVALQTEDKIESPILWVEQFEIGYDHARDEAREAVHDLREFAEVVTHG